MFPEVQELRFKRPHYLLMRRSVLMLSGLVGPVGALSPMFRTNIPNSEKRISEVTKEKVPTSPNPKSTAFLPKFSTIE